MSRRLIVLLALVFVAAFTCAAYAEVQNVKVSGDLSVYGIGQSQMGLNKSGDNFQGDITPTHETALATIVRVKVDADLTDNVMATVRLINERYWGRDGHEYALDENLGYGIEGGSPDIGIDLAYVTLKEFLYSPLTLMVGRQELHYGNQMIIGDVDTNALASANEISGFGSEFAGNAALDARKAFDAFRAVLNYDPLVVDLVYAKISEGFDAFEHAALMENDDTNLYGINAAYKIDANTVLEGYWWLKNTAKKAFSDTNSKTSAVHVLGAHLGNVMAKQDVNLTSSLEGAIQLGKYNDNDGVVENIRAYALEAGLSAGFKNAKYTPSATLLAAYFSGKKDPGTTDNVGGRMKGWDPMFENQAYGDIANQMLPQTNSFILGGIATMKPAADVMLKGEFYAYWANQGYEDIGLTMLNGRSILMTDKKFLGTELDLSVDYNYTEDVSFGLLCGMLFPGNAVDNVNDNMASELIGSMKVTF